LARRGYAEEVYMDEFQAYAVGSYKGDGDGFGKSVDGIVREEGRNIGKYCQENIIGSDIEIVT
jgi:hypothetical protein